MPLFSWNMKGGDPAIRSLGPTAQDFYQAFALGNDDKSIASLNLEGVALAAIKGLNQLVEEKDSKIEAQKQAIEALREELEALKRVVAHLTKTDARVIAR